ncbi:MAG: DUF3857 domain-containing protein [Salinivirgaceae bacterium]
MNKITTLVSMALALTISLGVYAQKAPIKFGKLSKDEIDLRVYDKDTAAVAIVLCDFGTSDFTYSDNSGLMYLYKRNIRIKILKKEGYHKANFEIPIRKKYDNPGRIRGLTFNFDEGKTEKVKLENNQVFTDDINKYWDLIKFEMPAVKEGSIIDVEYSILSELYDIRNWNFQDDIPTLYSEYRVTIPEYFHYKQLEKGYIPIDEKSTNNRTVTQTGTENQRSTGLVTTSRVQNYNFSYNVTDYFFISKHVPAFYEENYMTSEKNYITSIEFELGSVKWPNRPVKNYTNTWEAINKELLFDTDFGNRINGAGFLKDKLALIESLNPNPEAKIAAVYDLIRNGISWNGRYSIYSFDNNKAWNEGSGTVGDINLLLVAALKRLGFEANPVLLSTRTNGLIHPAQIILDQFNYVIASVLIDNKTILLDATDRHTPAGLLPERCLNGQGRQIDKNGGSWVDLLPASTHRKSYQTIFTIEPDLSLKGNIIEKHEGYSALENRKDMQNYNSTEAYLEEYQKRFQTFSLELDSVSGVAQLNEPLYLSYSFETDVPVDAAGNLLMINPILIGKTQTNPFKLPERAYPVDFSFPRTTTYMGTITIPDGYAVDNLPQNKRMILPENKAAFIYSIQHSGNNITILTKFDINKVTFLPEDYENLKLFYNQVIEAQAEDIILKKL